MDLSKEVVWQQQRLVQTFLFLGAAEAAGGFLELIAVNFDHPEGAKHLRQVGRFIAAGIQKTLMVWVLTSNGQEKSVMTSWAHQANRTQQYMMAAPMMATALPSFWMPS